MIIKRDKNQERQKRKLRVRGKISGSADRPRLNVYRSACHIYAQLVDDGKGVTLAAASTLDKKLKGRLGGKNKTQAAALVGADIAAKALAKGIKSAVFDRGGYLYTGRVKAVAESAREAGLKF